MSPAAEKQIEHSGEAKRIAAHDHDLVHELSKRLDFLWRFDQYIANARDHKVLRKLWRDMKHQERTNVERLKDLI